MPRLVSRESDQMRETSIQRDFIKHAEGSVLISFGDTRVVCTASIENGVPSFMRGGGAGWITSEYGMLPRSTGERMAREASKGKQSGRTQEIQRLIGRSLRAAVDLKTLGEITIKIDCDVIQADGGTRTASITGAWIALHDAIKFLMSKGKIDCNPIVAQVAAISCGIVNGTPLIDLDYNEDSSAEVDANFVLTDSKKIVEIQTTSEKKVLSKDEFLNLYQIVENEIDVLFQKQLDIIA